MKTKVTLVEWPRNPIATVNYLWDAARSNDKLLSPEQYAELYHIRPERRKAMYELFEKIIDSAIPIAENLTFVFLLEGVSISFREQMVRHKIGVKVGERLGVDMFPDIHESTWWAQSMRVLDMGSFVEQDLYRLPESIAGDDTTKGIYEDALRIAQQSYKDLLARGVPIEDAREVIPLAAGHRVSWGLNLSALMHVCKKRSCWIPQIGTWEPVIKGMIKELVEKVDPYFANIVTPPCIKGNEFKGCVYVLDNERRVKREDPLLPCALYMSKQGIDPVQVMSSEEMNRFRGMSEEYENFWQRNTETGERLVRSTER